MADADVVVVFLSNSYLADYCTCNTHG
jgi:hypothetical protein